MYTAQLLTPAAGKLGFRIDLESQRSDHCQRSRLNERFSERLITPSRRKARYQYTQSVTHDMGKRQVVSCLKILVTTKSH